MTVQKLQYMIGGLVIFLESINNEKLIRFYEEKSGFKRFATKSIKRNKDISLIQMLRIL